MRSLLAALSLCLLSVPAYAPEKKQPSAAQKKQQERTSACNKEAKSKGLKGDERKNFMSGCLKGDPEMKSRGLRG